MHRVEFDATLDDEVDVNVRLVQHTQTYHRRRRESQWAFALGAAGVTAVGLLSGDEIPSYFMVGLAAAAAPMAGVVVGMLSGRYYDWRMRRGYRSLLDEMFRDDQTIHCEFELRDEGLWSRSINKSFHAEVSFPWSKLTRVADRSGSIELWFDPGLAIIRDRAFHTPDERQSFLAAVRQHLA